MSESNPPSPETLSTVLIVAAILHALAAALTSFRLWFRYHIRRLWWDDFWAALAALCDAVCMIAMWLFAAPVEKPTKRVGALPTSAESRSTHITAFWLGVLFYTCTIWFARISIVFSVIRIVPPARGVNILVFGAAAIFACMWFYVFIGKVVTCSLDESWYHTPSMECPIPRWVALSEVCTDVSSDIILVILPLRLLWHVKLPSNQKIMVLSVFSASILVTATSVVHTAYLVAHTAFIDGVTAQMEGAVSVIVCNLLVTVTFLYRMMTSEDLTITPANKNSRPSKSLTTVDLSVSGGSLFTSMGISTITGTTGTGPSALAGTQIVTFPSADDNVTPSDSATSTSKSTNVLPASE